MPFFSLFSLFNFPPRIYTHLSLPQIYFSIPLSPQQHSVNIGFGLCSKPILTAFSTARRRKKEEGRGRRRAAEERIIKPIITWPKSHNNPTIPSDYYWFLVHKLFDKHSRKTKLACEIRIWNLQKILAPENRILRFPPRSDFLSRYFRSKFDPANFYLTPGFQISNFYLTGKNLEKFCFFLAEATRAPCPIAPIGASGREVGGFGAKRPLQTSSVHFWEPKLRNNGAVFLILTFWLNPGSHLSWIYV